MSEEEKKYISDEEVVEEIKLIVKMEMPKEIGEALRLLKEKTKISSSELQKQLIKEKESVRKTPEKM